MRKDRGRGKWGRRRRKEGGGQERKGGEDEGKVNERGMRREVQTNEGVGG